MNKPNGLRRLLLKAVPGLADNPDRLQMSVERGAIGARAGASLSFEYRYTLTVTLLAFAGNVDAVMVPIVAWIAEQQPDLLKREDQQPFTFETEIQDEESADVRIDIDLTERVRVTPRAAGVGYDVVHLDDDAAQPDHFPGVCGQNLWQLFLRDELIAETRDPAFQPPAP
ncbi:MAG TPA: phage tail protein [Sphingomonas sp.]|jgi:hypothetical protein|uniref:phage tail protein n=1 Tax=Sphingomonas sp. TaxID=28214 RepID=UPI002ED98D72